MTFTLQSAAFGDGDAIPARYTRDGENLSPPLRWHDPPPATKSFALIVEDPDAPGGTFHHWALFDIAADITGIAEGVGHEEGGSAQAVNGFGRCRYDGPQPPPCRGAHRYSFRLVALGIESLDVGETADVIEIWEKSQPHILAEARLTGIFETR
jgi:Raf kinase inhibitor-like YbhB/YbcL family protein